jgi:hypothetical protein
MGIASLFFSGITSSNILVCFFGEGIISLREDGRGYENPGFGCLPGMKLHKTYKNHNTDALI